MSYSQSPSSRCGRTKPTDSAVPQVRAYCLAKYPHRGSRKLGRSAITGLWGGILDSFCGDHPFLLSFSIFSMSYILDTIDILALLLSGYLLCFLHTVIRAHRQRSQHYAISAAPVHIDSMLYWLFDDAHTTQFIPSHRNDRYGRTDGFDHPSWYFEIWECRTLWDIDQ